MLFFDPMLSKDNTISCASCHLSFTAFTHADHSLSHGIYGKIGKRNSLTLMNLAWNTSFMWDGAINNLELQAINPITSPLEMDSKLEEVIAKLNQSPKYRQQFYRVFEDSTVTVPHLLKALAQFTVMLNSSNSKYDSVMRKEKGVRFNPSEQKGYALFQQHCAACHAEPLFTNHSFQNNGLAIDTTLNDTGRMSLTGDSADYLKFRVPTLRNIEYSAPYFHDGRVNKLKDVLAHYTNGVVNSKTLAKELQVPMVLSTQDKKDILNFLKTLTDPSFLYNERFTYSYSNKE
jgi:cytochrome c peroxidase